MKKITFMFAFVLAVATNGKAANVTNHSFALAEAPSDTLRSYNIDGVHIKNFTGKELVGKTIKSYIIRHGIVVNDNKILETHLIKTTTPPVKNEPEPHYIVDGKEINHQEMLNISPSKIESIDVLKAGSKAALQYGKDGDTRGYVIIKIKKN